MCFWPSSGGGSVQLGSGGSANPSPTLEWGTGPRPEKRQNSLSSSPHSRTPRYGELFFLHTRSDTSHSGETPNTQLVLDFCTILRQPFGRSRLP